MPTRRAAPNALALAAAALLPLAAGCNERALQGPRGDAGSAVSLSPEQAGRVVARVGDTTITLGDFAATLERMDQYDRLRYQTKEKRRELLDEMIQVELLAREAERRGLDRAPEVEEAVRQILRDAVLARARGGIDGPMSISAEEVRAFYEANAEKFREPERRRVAAIVLAEAKEAEKLLKEAQKASPTEWGELFYRHSVTAEKKRPAAAALELAGDLGIVGPPGDPRGAHDKVPEAVRAAVFALPPQVGAVAGEVVTDGGKHFIVRLAGRTEAHARSFPEAERTIRIQLMQQKIQEREKALEAELRKKYPVEVDEAALARVAVPAIPESAHAGSGASPRAAAPDAGDGR